MQRHKSDSYVKQAIDGDLRSRSAFKLIQLQEDYKLIKPDSYVIDLGSAPGGWSVACAGFLRLGADAPPSAKPPTFRTSTAASVAPTTYGYLCSVDLLDMKPVPGTHFIQGDFRTSTVQSQIEAVGESRGRQVRQEGNKHDELISVEHVFAVTFLPSILISNLRIIYRTFYQFYLYSFRSFF